MSDTNNQAPTQPAAANTTIANTVFQTAAPIVLGLVAKKWPKSLTICSAILAIGASGMTAYQAYTSKDMTAFGSSIAGMLGGVGAIVGRAKAVQPISG